MATQYTLRRARSTPTGGAGWASGLVLGHQPLGHTASSALRILISRTAILADVQLRVRLARSALKSLNPVKWWCSTRLKSCVWPPWPAAQSPPPPAGRLKAAFFSVPVRLQEIASLEIASRLPGRPLNPSWLKPIWLRLRTPMASKMDDFRPRIEQFFL